MKYYSDNNFIFLNFIYFIFKNLCISYFVAGGICINIIGQPDRNLQKHNTEIIKAYEIASEYNRLPNRYARHKAMQFLAN